MENQLTPSKIERLINLAQGCRTPAQRNYVRSNLLSKIDESQLESLSLLEREMYSITSISAPDGQNNNNEQSSSGILDLENCEGFGDGMGLSMNKSTPFNPGEMTGRSTETEETCITTPHPRSLLKATMELSAGRYTWSSSNNAINTMVDKLNKQSSDVKELLRNSIASGYSFHTRDLTADELSLVNREAPLPVPQNELNLNITRNVDLKELSLNSTMSVGTYFQNRCGEFKFFTRTDSPQYDVSGGTNLSEGDMNLTNNPQHAPKTQNQLDTSLDSVPVRQPRITNTPLKVPLAKSSVTASVPVPPPIPPFPASTNKSLKLPAFLADPSKQYLTAMQPVNEESSDCSFSISAIASYLETIAGKDSEIDTLNNTRTRVTNVMNKVKHDTKQNYHRKEPLSEINSNIINENAQDYFVSNLQRMDTATTVDTVNTVVPSGKEKRENGENIPHSVPAVIVSRYSNEFGTNNRLSDHSEVTRTKSPASRTRSTYSTVQENLVSTSYRSGDSPLQSNRSQGEHKISHILTSPNVVEYKELDKSVDWQEVMRRRSSQRREGLAKVSMSEDWADISVDAVTGFVGVCTQATISVKTLTDSWLTARFEFNKDSFNDKDIIIDLPRFPVLLSPKKQENFTILLTSNLQLRTKIQLTLKLKDASIDMEMEQIAEMEVDFKLPHLQTITTEGINNRIVFLPAQERKVLKKAFVLISDVPADLLLDLSVMEGSSMFSISNIQEIERSDLKTSLSENYKGIEDPKHGRQKPVKAVNKQSCRLSAGNAIRALLTFTAPKLSELQLKEKQATFNGALSVQIIGTSTLLRKIDLAATVGTVQLVLKVPSNKLHLNNESAVVKLSNAGTIVGVWTLKFVDDTSGECPFTVSSRTVEVHPGTSSSVMVQYTGSDDQYHERYLVFEDTVTKDETSLLVSGGKRAQKHFPIKTTLGEISWVREGRKEISLKNCSEKRVTVKCKVDGNGFMLETPKASGTDLMLTFAPAECRALSIHFAPTSMMPHTAKLYILTENDTDTGKNVRLHGCACGGSVRWQGLVTYGDTALVRAQARQPVLLTVYNRSRAAAFISARVHFNLQYAAVSPWSVLSGALAVVPGRGCARLQLAVEWARVERTAREAGAGAGNTLATVTVLTGAEYTRRRILKILKDESNGKLDVSRLSDPLQRLIGPFQGEDNKLEETLQGFQETRKSMEVLMSGLQELTAQIDLQQDFADRTILLTDDTLLEHHTLYD